MMTKVRRLATLAMGAVLALVVMELAIRQIYMISYSHEPGYGPIYTPGSTIRWSVEGRGEGHWTVHGLRGRTPPDPARPSILVLGDSFTEAPMIDDADVFPAVLERLLGGRWQLLNAGRGLSSLADYVAYVGRNLALFAPQWTIIELSDDDVTDGAWDADTAHFVRDGGALRAVPRPDPPPPWYGLNEERHNPLSHFMLLRYAILRLLMTSQDSHQPRLFHAGDTHAPPLPPKIDRPIEEELALAVGAYAERVTFLYFSQYRDLVPAAERRTRAACVAHGWSCVFLRDAFPSLAGTGLAPYGFANTTWNAGHPNRLGHRLAAELLARELARLNERGLL